MSDRELLARFNSLLSAGLTLEQAEHESRLFELSESFARHFQLFKGLVIEVGASPARAMLQLQEVAKAQAESRARLEVSAAAPRATARLVLGLPLLTLLFGELLGLGSITVFFRNSFAAISLLVGLSLLMLAHIWSSRIMQKISFGRIENMLFLECMVLCLEVGMPVASAALLAQKRCAESYTNFDSGNELDVIQDLVALSEETGVAIANLLRERSAEKRNLSTHTQLKQIEKSTVQLMLPLGVLVLPAFVFISVIPLVISVLSER